MMAEYEGADEYVAQRACAECRSAAVIVRPGESKARAQGKPKQASMRTSGDEKDANDASPLLTRPPATDLESEAETFHVKKRYLLAIGCSDYEDDDWKTLPNADEDALAMAMLFSDVYGDDYVKCLWQADDTTAQAIKTNIFELAQKVGVGDLVVIHFSGHGVEIHGVNYLVGADCKGSNLDALDEVGAVVPVDFIFRQFSNKGAGVAIFLDCCREHMRSGNPLGTHGFDFSSCSSEFYIMFSCASGQMADDGARGKNSPFTTLK